MQRMLAMCTNNPTIAFGCDMEGNGDTAGEVFTGAWCDFQHKVVNSEVLETHIEFQPAFIQRGETVAIPVWEQNEGAPPRLCIDMYGPISTDEGAMFEDLGGEDPSGFDTIFSVDLDADDKITIHKSGYNGVGFEPPLPVSPPKFTTGWLYRWESDHESQLAAKRILRNHRRFVDKFQFAGVCGAMQPDVDLIDMLCYVIVLEGNIKIVVDDAFYDRTWTPGEPVELRLVNPRNIGNLERLDVIYRHPDEPDDDKDEVVYKFIIGTFIVEATMPHCCAANILLTGANVGL